MTTPCEQAPTIARVADKVDKIYDSLTVLAVQKDRLDRLREDVDDHEVRIRRAEDAPSKRLEKAAWLLVGGIGSVLLVVIARYMGG